MPLSLSTPKTQTATTVEIGRVVFLVEEQRIAIDYGEKDAQGNVVQRGEVSCDFATAQANWGTGGLKARMYTLLQFLLGAAAAGTVS